MISQEIPLTGTRTDGERDGVGSGLLPDAELATRRGGEDLGPPSTASSAAAIGSGMLDAIMGLAVMECADMEAFELANDAVDDWYGTAIAESGREGETRWTRG
jgi:hypothetical protein